MKKNINRRSSSMIRTEAAEKPPQYVPTMSFRHRFRFSQIEDFSTGTSVITREQMLNLLLTATSTVSTVRVIQAIRIIRVQVWVNPQVLGSTPSQCSLEWVGSNAPSTLVSDTAMGVRPAYINTVPPPNSSAKWWSMSGSDESDPLFILNLPSGNSIVDLTVQIRLVDSENPTAGETPVGATLGQLYGDYLDGKGIGNLVMVDYVPLP